MKRQTTDTTEFIVFATYWNEEELISHSLEQIERMRADWIYINSGCFDPNFQQESTDLTDTVLVNWAKQQGNVTIIQPSRKSKVGAFFSYFLNVVSPQILLPLILRIPSLVRFSAYRLNQADTFNRMLKMARNSFGDSIWCCPIDSDQFFNDNTVDIISKRKWPNNVGYFSSKEMTFINSFNEFTFMHENRDYNNMPHFFDKSSFYYPTRHPSCVKDLKIRLISQVSEPFKIDNYFHYKYRDSKRLEAGYSLGDRKKHATIPLEHLIPFTGKHPKSIINWIKK